MSAPKCYHLLVGTTNTPHIYALSFTPPQPEPGEPASLHVINKADTVGSHSWLYLQSTNSTKKLLYATAWTEPPCLVAYDVSDPTTIQQINKVDTATRSGYVCASSRALYSAAGAVGEVFRLDASTGSFAVSGANMPAQTLDFVKGGDKKGNGGDSVMDFGGLRHGAHSADLSPDRKALYIADTGRNCIWVYRVDHETALLTDERKYDSPRDNDGPRHTHPHPNGRYLYCVQEHSCMVDIFDVGDDSVSLTHVQAVKIIPDKDDPALYWADEVRTSLSDGERPKYLYASTRGLESDPENKDKYRRGWVCAFKLGEDGMIETGVGKDENGSLHMWETPTSGGWSNAIQPGPTIDGIEYIALVDAEKSQVMVLGWDGKRIDEVAKIQMDAGAVVATAVWL